MKATKQARREAKQLFRLCLVNGLLDENRARQVVQQVVAAKPRGYLAMLSHFQRLVRLDQRAAHGQSRERPDVASGFAGQRAGGFGARLRAGLNTSFAENPALIGGMRIRVGSDVYDGSVRARLAALEQSF